MARDNSRETRKHQQALTRLEDRIQSHEIDMEQLNKALQHAGNGGSYVKVQTLSLQYARAQEEMESLIQEWEALAV